MGGRPQRGWPGPAAFGDGRSHPLEDRSGFPAQDPATGRTAIDRRQQKAGTPPREMERQPPGPARGRIDQRLEGRQPAEQGRGRDAAASPGVSGPQRETVEQARRGRPLAGENPKRRTGR